MLLISNTLRRFFACALLAITLAPSSAFCGWMGFKNDTGKPLIIQENYASGRNGKPQKVFANETIRDTPPAAGVIRKFTIYDANKPDLILATGNFPAPGENENLLYVIKLDAKGAISIEPIQNPMIKK